MAILLKEGNTTCVYHPLLYGHLSNYMNMESVEVEGPQEQIDEELAKPKPKRLESNPMEVLDFNSEDE